MKKLIVVLLTISSIALSGDALSAQEEMLTNGTFDLDVNDWTVGLVFGSTGTIEWSSSQGLPPGALRMVGDDQASFPEECFLMTPGVFNFSADGFMDTDPNVDILGCGLNLAIYVDEVDCTGNYYVIPILDGDLPPALSMANQWQRLQIELTLPQQSIEDLDIVSFRPIFEKYGDMGSDDACVWDNASMTMTPFLTAVPTMSEVGLAVLCLLLIVAAVAILRRTSS